MRGGGRSRWQWLTTMWTTRVSTLGSTNFLIQKTNKLPALSLLHDHTHGSPLPPPPPFVAEWLLAWSALKMAPIYQPWHLTLCSNESEKFLNANGKFVVHFPALRIFSAHNWDWDKSRKWFMLLSCPHLPLSLSLSLVLSWHLISLQKSVDS